MCTDNDDDVPVLIFSGPYSDAVSVKILVESAGIETSFDNLAFRGRGSDSKIYVRKAAAAAASEIVADFLERGQSTAD